MKFIIGFVATLFAGGTLVAAELPAVDFDECAIVSLDIASGEPTFIDPDPAATSMRIFVYCGQRTLNTSGTPINQRALKWIDVDVEQAEVILQAAEDLVEE